MRPLSLSLRTLTLITMVIGTALAMLVSGYMGIKMSRDARLQELLVRGRVMALGLAEADEALFAEGEARARELIQRLVQVEDVAYMVLTRPDGSTVASQRGARWRNLDLGLFQRKGPMDTVENAEPEAVALPSGDTVFAFATTVRAPDGKSVGQFHFGLSQRAQDERFPGPALLATLAFFPLLALALVVWLLLGRLLAPFKQILRALHDFEAGDLSARMSLKTPVTELADLGLAVNALNDNLKTVTERSRAAADQIRHATTEVTIAVHKQAQSAGDVAQSIGETGATVRGLAQASSQAAERAQAVIEMAGRSEEFSRSGLSAVEESVQEMRAVRERVEAIAGNITDLSDRMQQIGDIIATVTELAERSNLLALNAAIEAAKAGPQGRGFAVVAVEMRNLAEGSKSAANQVRGIIADIQKAMRAVVEVTEEGSARAAAGGAVAERTGHDIRRLVEAIRESSLAAKQIAAMAKQQNLGIESVAGAVSGIHDAIVNVLGGIRDLESTSQKLREQSEQIAVILDRYGSRSRGAQPTGLPAGPGQERKAA